MICTCGERMVGVEYEPGSKYRYGGVSEYSCPKCRKRIGRWCGNDLADGEVEPKFHEGNRPHPRVFDIEQGTHDELR